MESKSIIVAGKNIHYLAAGKGQTLLFLHGVPGSAAMWEPIISAVSPHAYCVAPDLIGFGKSDKPRLNYSVEDHLLFLKGFIESLNLKQITLVLNNWGSIIGLEYARQYPDDISGLVLTEAYLRLEKNYQDISYFFEKIKMLEESKSAKLKSLLTDPFWKTLEDNPYINPESPVVHLIENYSAGLQKNPIKKLLLFSNPGFIVTKATVAWANKMLPNITAVDLGLESVTSSDAMATHFSKALLDWL
jgi:haloalkane dehalogenase